MNKVHVCPILIRTVIWSDGQCTENCVGDSLGNGCPIYNENWICGKFENKIGEIGDRDI